jgi:hypothetical protein
VGRPEGVGGLTDRRPDASDLAELSPGELRELIAAAAWYAKRHEPFVAAIANDPSAGALVERERYLLLHDALRKLGVRLRLPDGVARPTGQ